MYYNENILKKSSQINISFCFIKTLKTEKYYTYKRQLLDFEKDSRNHLSNADQLKLTSHSNE